jgi:hypothetical protein
MSKAHMHAPHSSHSGGLFAGASSPFLFSLPFLLFLFFFSSLLPPLPVLFSKTGLGKRAPGKQPHGWSGGRLGSSCGPWARVKHLYCAQEQCISSTTSIVVRKRRIFEVTLSVFKDTVDDILDGRWKRGVIALCTAEVWTRISF